MNFAPNAFGEVSQAGAYASNLQYHPTGSIKSLTYGNGRVYTTTQNSRRLPENLKVMSGSTALVNLSHGYDPNANLLTITDAVNASANRSMTYDGLDRLKTASGRWGAGSYSYDVLGNIQTKTEGGQAMTYNYNTSLNRLTAITGANARSFSYDSRGNVTGNGNQTFSYNLAGNLISSTGPGITYVYDGQKRRVKKTEGSQTSYSVYSQAGTLLHKKVGGVATDYIYAGSLLVAEKSGATTHYLHTDLLGSPVAGTNGSSYTEYYRPWGEKWSNPIQLADDVGYTGHQSDVATGLTYMQARYYDPVVGRFMAVDPVGFTASNPMSFNRYLYVNNNPYKYTDPDGRFLGLVNAIGAAISIAVYYGTAENPTLGGAAIAGLAGATGGGIINASAQLGRIGLALGTSAARTTITVGGLPTSVAITQAAGVLGETAGAMAGGGALAATTKVATNIAEAAGNGQLGNLTHPIAGAGDAALVGAVIGPLELPSGADSARGTSVTVASKIASNVAGEARNQGVGQGLGQALDETEDHNIDKPIKPDFFR